MDWSAVSIAAADESILCYEGWDMACLSLVIVDDGIWQCIKGQDSFDSLLVIFKNIF